MDITIIGSGTAIPSEGHSPAGIVVFQGGFPLLLDIGPGTISRLHLARTSYDQIDTLLISHLHPDHTLDLATILQVFDSTPNAQRTRIFSIYGCRGIDSFLKRLFILYPEITPQTYKLVVREVFRDHFSIGDLLIESAPSGHTGDSVAYRIKNSKSVLVYSGDASNQDELVRLADSADIFICECSFPAGWRTTDHLTAESAGRIAQQAGVRKLVITHRYPPALAIDLIDQISTFYSGDVVLATDGLHLTLA